MGPRLQIRWRRSSAGDRGLSRERYFTVTEEAIGPTDELRVVAVADLRWLICEVGQKFAGQSAKANGKDESRLAIAIRTGAMLKAGGASNDDKRSGVGPVPAEPSAVRSQ